MAINAYEQHLREKETIGYAETIRRLRLFFPDLTMLIGRVTPERGKKWYDAFRERKRGRVKKDGTPRKAADKAISVSYHRATLINVRSMFTFCIEEQKWLRENPLAKVKGIGKRKSGKRKPTGNELRQWYAHTWARVEAGDRTALGLMMAFAMSLRSADLTRRKVRDVDMDGTQLLIEDGKSEKSNEPRLVPDRLQPYVRRLVAGRDPMEPLFFRRCKGKLLHLTRRWLEQGMERTCAAAGVPYFCPHALKGASGTVLAKRGAAANVIMDHLSHEEDATTFRHYVDRSLVDAAQAEQAFRVIAGGKR
jgi:integrase